MSSRTVMALVLAASVALGGLARAAPASSQGTPQLTPAERAFFQGMFAGLEDADDEVVAWVLMTLCGSMDALPEYRERLHAFLLTPRLQRALRSPGSSLGRSALITQATLGEAPPDTARFLVDLLAVEGQQPRIRERAKWALVKMGEAAHAQVPRIAALLNHQDVDVSEAAGEVLGAMGGVAREAAPRVVDLLKEPERSEWTDPVLLPTLAARTLRSMGEAAREQVPRIAAMLKDPDPRRRAAAAQALGFMGTTAREQAPLLVDRLLKDPSADVRQSAAQALRNMGEAAREQAPVLVDRLLKDPSADVRQTAALALGFMG
ncbi:HEAT repeat domain-containing protein, partial [Archangium violaceum]